MSCTQLFPDIAHLLTGLNRNYRDWLLERLKDRDEAVAYLNTALEESLRGDGESQHLFLIALRNVAEAQGGIGVRPQKVLAAISGCGGHLDRSAPHP